MAPEQFNVEGHVAIVTGTGKWVGQGIATVMAGAGATGLGTARTEWDIVATIDGIDIRINNVGCSSFARFLDVTDEDFKLRFDCCVKSTVIMSQLVAPNIVELIAVRSPISPPAQHVSASVH